ncbi:MAG: YIP1 family protein [Bacillota bacterium]
MYKKKTLIVLISFIIILIPTTLCFAGNYYDFSIPYESYTYDFWGEPVPGPHPYLPLKMVSGLELDVGELKDPEDIFVSQRQNIYILDSGNNRLICTNQDWEVINIIKEFTINNEVNKFDKPHGVYVTEEENIYVADTGNERVIEFNLDGEVIREISPPQSEVEGVFPEDFKYKPVKLVEDQSGDIYVISKDFLEGLMNFNNKGEFSGLIGAPRVTPSPADYFWKIFATEAQKERMSLFLPTNYNNLALDPKGFIYATVSVQDSSGQDNEPVKRLNPSGEDILRRTGNFFPVGDVKYPDSEEASITGSSNLIDVSPLDNNIYSVLDSKRGRIFTYDKNGNLLYAFGYKGYEKGLVRKPVAMEYLDKNILILDRNKNGIIVYEPTTYAENIIAANQYFHRGRHEKSLEKWQQVLELNSNYDLAYTGIGKTLLRQENYESAMANFKLGNNRDEYSDAFEYYRKEVINEKFELALLILVLLGIIFWGFKRLIYFNKKKELLDVATTFGGKLPQGEHVIKTIKSIGYSFHLIFHPFDGFWDLKHEKKGNLPAALTILGIIVMVYVIIRQYTGFIFNENNLTQLNIIIEFTSILLPFILWCGANWGITTLMEGKGTFKEIIIATSFSLVPIILLYIPLTYISHFLILEEGAFYYFIMTLAVFWSGCLLFLGGIITTHEYSMSKGLLTTILTIGGMGFILFIGLLFFNITEQMIVFVNEIINEVLYRM